MILRRYYARGMKYGYYFHPEIKTYHELISFAEANPEVPTMDYDNASYEMILSKEEQKSYWIESIKKVMLDTRNTLDSLDSMTEFTVWWNRSAYHARKRTIGKPPEIVTKTCNKLYNHIK